MVRGERRFSPLSRGQDRRSAPERRRCAANVGFPPHQGQGRRSAPWPTTRNWWPARARAPRRGSLSARRDSAGPPSSMSSWPRSAARRPRPRQRRAGRLDETGAHCDGDGVSALVDAEALEDRLAVRADRGLGDAQPPPDLGAAGALGHVAQDLAQARRQGLALAGGLLQAGRHVRLALRGVMQRAAQRVKRVARGVQDVDAVLAGGAHGRCALLGAGHHQARVGAAVAQCVDERPPVDAAVVEQPRDADDVRAAALRAEQREGLTRGRGFAFRLQRGVAADDLADDRALRGLALNDEDAEHGLRDDAGRGCQGSGTKGHLQALGEEGRQGASGLPGRTWRRGAGRMAGGGAATPS